MKRFLFPIILSFFIIALLYGCMFDNIGIHSMNDEQHISSDEESRVAFGESIFIPESDWAFGVNTTTLYKNLAPAADGYYIILTDYLFYMDADIMELVPVCFRPDCQHYNEPEYTDRATCSAFVYNGMKSFLTYYGGKLYYIDQIESVSNDTQYALICIEPDGSDRKVLYRFDEMTLIQRAVIHRGILYAQITFYDEEAKSQTKLWAYSLTDTSKKPECVLSFDDPDRYHGLYALTAYGDRLYFYRRVSEEGAREFYSYHLRTGQLTAITLPDQDYGILNETFIGDRMYLRGVSLYPVGDDPNALNAYPARLYRCDLEGGGMELLLEGFGEYSSDQRYLYRVPSQMTFDAENHWLRIYDPDGRELDSVDLYGLVPKPSIREAGVQIPAGDQGFLWVRTEQEPQRVYLYWFDKHEIGSGHIMMHPLVNYLYYFNSNMVGSELFDFDTASMQEMVDCASATQTSVATTPAEATMAVTTTTTTGATTAVEMGPLTNAAGYDTGSIRVEDLGIDLGGGTAEYMTSDSSQAHERRLEIFEGVCDYINGTYNGNVTLTLEPYETYGAALRVRIDAGEAPDAFFTMPRWLDGCNYPALIAEGALLPLNDYIDDCLPRTFTKTDERLYGGITFDGRIYGILHYQGNHGMDAILYDKARTDAAGAQIDGWVRYSDTWDTLYRLRAWMDQNEPERAGVPISQMFIEWSREGRFAFPLNGSDCVGIQYAGFEAVKGRTAESEVFNIYDCPEFAAYIKSLSQMVTDRIFSEFRTKEEQGFTASSDTEQGKTYVVRWLYSYEGDRRLSEAFGLPAVEWTVSRPEAVLDFSYTTPYVISAVSADSENPGTACRLIEILNNDRYVGTVLRFGEEDRDWKRTADGRLDGSAGRASGVYQWVGNEIGDITNCILTAAEPLDYFEVLADIDARAVYSENNGFIADSEPVQAECAAVNALADAYLTDQMLYSGRLTPAEIDAMVKEFIEALRAAGIDRIQEEYQRQLDEWRAGK